MNSINNDLYKDSKSFVYTPNLSSHKYPFYLLSCGHFNTGNSYSIKRDTLPGYLVIFTLSGSGFLQYAGKEFSIKPGQLFVLNCHEYHYYHTTGDHWEIKWFRFDGIAAESFYEQIYNQNFDIFRIDDMYITNDIFEDIFKWAQSPGTMSDIQLSTSITGMLNMLCKIRVAFYTKVQSNQKKELVEKAIAFMQNEYAQNISLDEICKYLHISTFYFSRIFRNQTGISPHSFLTRIRINNSKELLNLTDMSVGEISANVGFDNVNNFIRNFKLFTGTTPLKYRKVWTEQH